MKEETTTDCTDKTDESRPNPGHWTNKQLHELVMDLRAIWPEIELHRQIYDRLKPWFDAHNDAAALNEIRALKPKTERR